VAGKYRLIDIPLSNCINSGLNRIYVVTQFNSVSLHRHIRSSYVFDAFSGGFVEILAAQQTNENATWYQGTADAVRQNLGYVEQPNIQHVLILSGDQLYRMNFHDMIATHERSKADVTIAAVPVFSKDASGLGIMRLDDSGRVIGFLEKPQTEVELDHVRTSPEWIDAHGIPSHGRDCLANMGIYLFNRRTLLQLLEKTTYKDFGREIFPAAIRARHVQVHLFDGYWEDIGTIRSFFDANLALTKVDAPFDIRLPNAPIFSRPRFLPPSRIDGATIRQSLVADGCVIGEGTVVENSIIGLRCLIGPNVVIRNSVLMGNDFYQRPDGAATSLTCPPLGIGEGSRIEGAIIDKNCSVGRGVQILNPHGIESTEEDQCAMIRDGIVVIPKGAKLPDGWKL
jgi:glucose-1-phosphate adenylyltransferase